MAAKSGGVFNKFREQLAATTTTATTTMTIITITTMRITTTKITTITTITTIRIARPVVAAGVVDPAAHPVRVQLVRREARDHEI